MTINGAAMLRAEAVGLTLDGRIVLDAACRTGFCPGL